MFKFEFRQGTPLVAQIVARIGEMVDTGRLRAGAKLPSIRQFAHQNGVSIFTVVESYDRLVASGYVVSRLNAGFFVCARTASVHSQVSEAPSALSAGSFDNSWYLQRIFENHHLPYKPGCGWLPPSWLFEDGVRRAMRSLTAADPMPLGDYGDPLGYPPLRAWICESMRQQAIHIQPHQVLLTQGASQALDLAVRWLVGPGDVVLVDEPGYPNLINALRFVGVRPHGAPRTPDGWDLAALEDLIVRLRPKVFFTQPRFHSPTGSVATLQQLHKVLRLAEKYDVLLVENDIYCDLDTEARPSLASLDNLSRVVYVGSFSKSIAPSLRCGYLLAHADIMGDFSRLKMFSGLTSSELIERIVHVALSDSHRPRYLRSLRTRMTQAHERCAQRLRQMGFELFCEPRGGLFLWAWHPRIQNVVDLAARASVHGIMLAPGHLFSTVAATQNWMRFNVAQCESDADAFVYQWLERALAE